MRVGGEEPFDNPGVMRRVGLCAEQDVTPSQIVRQLIRDYLKEHGVQWQPSGQIADRTGEGAGGAG